MIFVLIAGDLPGKGYHMLVLSITIPLIPLAVMRAAAARPLIPPPMITASASSVFRQSGPQGSGRAAFTGIAALRRRLL
jgi:hypothetical protein